MQAEDEVDEGRLARTRRPNDRHRLARLDRHRDVLQGRPIGRRVPEGHVFKPQFSIELDRNLGSRQLRLVCAFEALQLTDGDFDRRSGGPHAGVCADEAPEGRHESETSGYEDPERGHRFGGRTSQSQHPEQQTNANEKQDLDDVSRCLAEELHPSSGACGFCADGLESADELCFALQHRNLLHPVERVACATRIDRRERSCISLPML